MTKETLFEMYFPDEELTWHGFKSHMESFMRQLLTDPITADVDDFLKSHDINKKKALDLLLFRPDPKDERSAVMLCIRRIHPEDLSEEDLAAGKTPRDNFSVTYKLPRENYKKKMRSIYINNFESNIVNEDNSVFANQDKMVDEILAMDDDNAYKTRGGMKKIEEDGATSCGSALQSGGVFSDGTQAQDGSNPNAGEWVGPLTKKPVKKGSIYMPDMLKENKKRTIHITEEQLKYIQEATAGDIGTGGQTGIAYPFSGVKPNDPTMNHKNIMKDAMPK